MIARIIIPKRAPLRLPYFDYIVPEEIQADLQIGQLVEVPLRSSLEFGIVHSLSGSNANLDKIKSLNRIVIKEPLLSEEQLRFLEEIGNLYHTSLGFLVKSNLLPLQKRKLKALETASFIRHSVTKQASKPTVSTYGTETERATLIQKLLVREGQILILTPELTDIKHSFAVIPEAHRDKTAVITSEMTDKELFAAWHEIWSGEKTIILGTRRALFLPFFNLTTIVLDEESNDSYKSWDMAPRFHTRDAALILSLQHKAELHLLSHSPCTETFFFAQKNIYAIASPTIPVLEKKYNLIDVRHEKREENYGFLSNELVSEIQKDTTVSIYLYSSRRGALSYISCRDCSTVVDCPRCKQPFTYHRGEKLFKCHHCHTQEPVSQTCKKCHSSNMMMFGAGTEQIMTELQNRLPNDPRPIIAVDMDLQGRETIDPERAQIIIGTQFAWGHVPWDKLGLVAFIDVDTPLYVPEYKSLEKTWLLMRDAMFKLPETAVLHLQTTHPEHIIFQGLYRPELFYNHELEQRKLFQYPPYRFVAKLYGTNQNQSEIEREARAVYQKLAQLTKNDPDITISPDTAMFPYYAKGVYSRVIIAKISYKSYKKSIKSLVQNIPETWKVDLNPNSLLSLS